MREDGNIWTRAVIGAYRGVVEGTGGHSFVHVKVSPKLESAANRLVEVHRVTGVGIRKLMEEAVSYYSREWCVDNFGRPYPPINVVLSPNNLNRLVRSHPKKVKAKLADMKEAARLIWNTQARFMKRDKAVATVESGMWPTDPDLNRTMLQMIRAGEI